MLSTIKVNVMTLYEITQQALEKMADVECNHIEGLFRSISALKRLVEQGQTSIVIPSGCWEIIANSIEEEADRIDNYRRARRLNTNYHIGY